jgi:hypothetical protein
VKRWFVSSEDRIFVIVAIGIIVIFLTALVTSALLIGTPVVKTAARHADNQVRTHQDEPILPNPEKLATDRILNRLRSQLAFDPPRELQMGETKTITLLLSPKKQHQI